MKYNVSEIKKGIKLHTIDTDKFKTNLVAVFLTTPLNRENVTYNAIIPSVLRRGSKSMPTQEDISKNLEEMYGAGFDCGLDKIGDNQVLKFYLESINDNFIPQTGENMLKMTCEKLLEITFNPIVDEDKFKEEYVKQEKDNIKQIIEGKKDNKARYAMDRCIEEMYKETNFGLYKYGYVEDLEKIDSKKLYEYYEKLKNECKIDIFISGKLDNNISEIIKENENIQKLTEREPNYIQNKLERKEKVQENTVEESMEVVQGKLVIGLDIDLEDEKLRYDTLVYNSILGGTANSKLFQNVREKESLAYTASSSYLKNKSNIFINCGIEIGNYQKALDIIKKQIEDMKNGDFTEEDIENAKKVIISTVKSIDDEQDTEITYFLGQELANNNVSLDEYINIIENITKDNIVNVANKVSINTIYFLRD